MARPKLSAVVITKDEKENIGDCLSTLDWVDEIVIVDSHSSDGTVEICRKFTDKVFSPADGGGYPQAKNYGIERASGEWILSLDADERVTPELKEEIEDKLMSEVAFDGYYIPRKNFLGDRWVRYGDQYPDYQLRLFRKDRGRFESRRVHERVQMNGKVGYLDNPLLHYTYKDLSDFLRRIDRYTTLEAQEMVSEGTRFRLYRLLLSPIKQFFRVYFFKRGYKEGSLGLILGAFAAYYAFLKHVKLWEITRRA
ncbi:MAG: glycosyltransferase family 2 protein [Actinomycetota bacterium]|nr:glycosyltransferase family 2 protein [Actinomycetota bacterium]